MIEKPPKKKSTKKINEYKLKNSIKLTQAKDRDTDYTKVLTQTSRNALVRLPKCHFALKSRLRTNSPVDLS